MLKIDNISLAIEEKNILSNISLDITSGENIAIIGPSGAGKTTLLKLLSRSMKSSDGKILLNNIEIADYGDSRNYASEVGIIRQHFDLVEPLSVLNNVLAGKLKDWNILKSIKSLIIPQNKEEAESALISVRLAEHIHSKTETLSGGEKQRVAIARLIVQNPNIILADEPIASLDPSLSDEILSLLKETATGKTLIVSIHAVEYAVKYFDRIIALKDGRVYFDEKSTDVTTELLNELYER